ncbi:MAG TPA: hypothetical protein VHD60_04835 [Candidatus Saccharimonadales bacterium]|nr:hypothetical protein [Candidatus Saccharimonadales bacterium]
MSAESAGETQLGIGMTEWAIALREAGLRELADTIDDDKLTSLNRVKEFGLPQTRWTYSRAEDFLNDPDATFEALDLDHYLAVLTPTRNPSLKRMRDFRLTKPEVIDFAKNKIPTQELAKYDIVLQEFFQHHYGGNIVCNPDGSVFVEVVKGELGHNDLVTQRKTADLIMQRSPITGFFSIDIENTLALGDSPQQLEPDLPKALWKAVFSIPHVIEGDHSPEYAARGAKFMPGYYEFYLDRRTENSSLEPFFVDCSVQKLYRLQA